MSRAAQRGMAITEYVVVSACVLAATLGLYGIPVSDGKSLLALMTEAMGVFLSAITIAISFP